MGRTAPRAAARCGVEDGDTHVPGLVDVGVHSLVRGCEVTGRKGRGGKIEPGTGSPEHAADGDGRCWPSEGPIRVSGECHGRTERGPAQRWVGPRGPRPQSSRSACCSGRRLSRAPACLRLGATRGVDTLTCSHLFSLPCFTGNQNKATLWGPKRKENAAH